MRCIDALLLGSALLLITSPPASGQAPASPAPSLETLGWLSGSWRTEGNPEVEEHWMAPRGGAMLGLSRTIAKGRMTGFEFLRIEGKEGAIDYVASPGGGPATHFRLLRASAQEAIFENSKHDFPKRIIYRLLPGRILLARIEGDGTEPEKAMEWRYRRN